VAVWTTRQAAGQGRVRVDRPRATYVGPNAEEGGSDGVARRWAGRASDATIAACALARRSGRRQPAGSPTAEDRDGAVAGHAGSCPLVAFGGRLGHQVGVATDPIGDADESSLPSESEGPPCTPDAPIRSPRRRAFRSTTRFDRGRRPHANGALGGPVIPRCRAPRDGRIRQG
jgi:hypothetical protein